MSMDWKKEIINSLSLDLIYDEELKKEFKKIIEEYLVDKSMQDALNIYSELKELIAGLNESSISISIIEQLEHIRNELSDTSFGPPTLVDLLKYRPETSEFQIPEVFYEHPETTKMRVIKTTMDGNTEKILDTDVVDVNQLKIHYIIGNLSKKVINNEEHLTKILNGEINYNWDDKIKYVLLNGIESSYPHYFDEVVEGDEVLLYPKSITMRIVPYKKSNNTGICFCPNCYNMFDNDELLDDDMSYYNDEIKREIIKNKLKIDINSQYCVKCSQRIFKTNDKKIKENTLLFSYMYKNNYYPDIIPIIEKNSKILYGSSDIIDIEDKLIENIVGKTYLSNNNSISELISGYQRLYKIHFNDFYKPSKGIYEWQDRKLRKSDNNIYYYWWHQDRKIPAKICIEKKNTDALSFEIPPFDESILEELPLSLILDAAFSSLNMKLKDNNEKRDIFSINSISEFINSYIYLSIDTSNKKTYIQILNEIWVTLNQLNDELQIIHDFCILNKIEYGSDLIPELQYFKNMVPINKKDLNNEITYQNDYGKLNLTKKISLLLRLFNVGNSRGSLFISAEKVNMGLDIDVLVKEIVDEISTIETLEEMIHGYMHDIYLHTLSHVLYRSAIEISKSDDNDISYDYSLPKNITIYDNYSGGAGFINECSETFDNLKFRLRDRPKFGFIQQIEYNLDLCMNYLSNYMLYGVSKKYALEELIDLTYHNSTELLEDILVQYNIDDLVYSKIIEESYDKNILPYVTSLIRQNFGIFYQILYDTFKFDYDDLILIQNCPTVSLFLLLCKLDNNTLTILLRHVFKDDVIINQNKDHNYILSVWEEVFNSDSGIFFSKYYRNYLSIFDNMITTCIKGCYDCSYISFNCNYSPFEQPNRINTFLSRLIYNKSKDVISTTFPLKNVDKELSKLKKLDEIYFKFDFKDFKSINELLNTILISLSENFDRVEPLYTIDIVHNNLHAYIKLRRKLA